MTELLKEDGGESALPFILAESQTPGSSSQLSEKHDSSSEEEQEGFRTITGFRVSFITGLLVMLLNL